MSRIFISYRREDSAWQAGRIYDRFAGRFGRESIFKDVDVIKAGDNFQECINEAVGQCDVLIAIIGQKWLNVPDAQGRRRLDNPADWVRLEIETALNRGDVRVIPVLLDKVPMPAAQDLPASLQPLCYRHAAYVRQDPDFSRDMDYVLSVIGQHLEQAETLERKQAAQRFYESADAKWKDKDYEGAIKDCNKALQLDPDFAEAYSRRGTAKHDLGDKQGVIADYDKALQLNPNYAHAYNNRGVAKSALGDKQGAIADYDKALQLNPNYADAYYNRGVAKSALGDKQGAIVDYDKALQFNPDDALAYNNRGNAKSELGDKQGAIADYDKALQVNPDYADAYNNRGVAKSALGDKQGAIVDYDKALQLNPDDASAYNKRGCTKYELGDKQGAITDYKKAIELSKQQGNTEYLNLATNNLKLIT